MPALIATFPDPAELVVSSPPIRLMLAAMLLCPAPLLSESAIRVRLRGEVTEDEVIAALMLMLLCACNVRVVPVPAVLLMVLATVMSPACALVPLVPVLMVTLVPAFNAF